MLSIILASLGFIIVLLVLTPIYAYFSTSRCNQKAIITKGATTTICFAYALAGYLKSNDISTFTAPPIHHAYWLLIGLGICTLADVILCLRFVIGGILFFLGHISYIIFFLTLGGFHTVTIVVFTLLCVAALCYFYRYSAVLLKYHLLFVLYGMITLANLALGLLLPYTYGFYGIIPAIASILLVVSDFFLARNKLFEETKFTKRIALSFYFGGQYLMAMTLYLANI